MLIDDRHGEFLDAVWLKADAKREPPRWLRMHECKIPNTLSVSVNPSTSPAGSIALKNERGEIPPKLRQLCSHCCLIVCRVRFAHLHFFAPDRLLLSWMINVLAVLGGRRKMADTDLTKRLKRGDQGLTPWFVQQPAARGANSASDGYEPSRTLLKAAVAAVVVGAAFSAWTLIGGVHASEGGPYGPDHVSTDDSDRRFDAYIHGTALVASEVSREERLRAIGAMGLSAEQQHQLAVDLSDRTSAIQSQAAPSMVNNEPVRLVWLTLWDTDNEDGDAISVDSGMGYTRTVNLTKQPLVMAVPVARGVPIKLKGIRDGEGGGITVGVASGNAQAALPIMSTGQVLALKVALP